MSLLTILNDVARERGNTDTAGDKASRVQDINAAAEEIHSSCDIPEALDEEVFDINVSSQQIALPAYVDRVRGHRYFDSRQSLDMDDGRNRYNYNNAGENETWYMQWRKKRTAALQREIANQSVLKFSIPQSETTDILITIVGKTDKSHRLSETITIVAGQTEVSSAATWKDVESVSKNRTTTYNLTVKDINDNVMAIVLNSELLSYYIIYQIEDTEGFQLSSDTSGVEMVFKRKFLPFVNDGDTFHGTNRYDKAVFWKYMEHISRKTEDAVMYNRKCASILSQLLTDSEHNIKRKIKFSQTSFFGLPYRMGVENGYYRQ